MSPDLPTGTFSTYHLSIYLYLSNYLFLSIYLLLSLTFVAPATLFTFSSLLLPADTLEYTEVTPTPVTLR